MNMRTRNIGLALAAASLLLSSAALTQEAPAPPPAPEPPKAAPPPEPPAPPVTAESIEMRERGEFPVKKPSPKKPDKKGSPSLEESILSAVGSSPDVQVAEAQLREAEARLRQARTQAAQQALEAYHNRLSAEEELESTQKLLEEVQKKFELGVADSKSVMELQQRAARAAAEVARQKAALQPFFGTHPSGKAQTVRTEEGLFTGPRVKRPRPSFDERSETVAALKSPLSIEFENHSFKEVANYINEYLGVNMVLDTELDDYPITLSLDNAPLEAAFLAIADRSGHVVFIVRDYGIFVTTRKTAETVAGPSIPEDVPYYVPVEPSEADAFGGLDTAGFQDAIGGIMNESMKAVEEAMKEVGKSMEDVGAQIAGEVQKDMAEDTEKAPTNAPAEKAPTNAPDPSVNPNQPSAPSPK